MHSFSIYEIKRFESGLITKKNKRRKAKTNQLVRISQKEWRETCEEVRATSQKTKIT